MYVDLLYLKLDRLYLGAEWGDTALIEILMLIILPCQFAIVFKMFLLSWNESPTEKQASL